MTKPKPSVDIAHLNDVYEFYVHPQSLYILQGPLRYNYTHAILGNQCIPKYLKAINPVQRRMSLMFRDSL